MLAVVALFFAIEVRDDMHGDTYTSFCLRYWYCLRAKGDIIDQENLVIQGRSFDKVMIDEGLSVHSCRFIILIHLLDIQKQCICRLYDVYEK